MDNNGDVQSELSGFKGRGKKDSKISYTLFKFNNPFLRFFAFAHEIGVNNIQGGFLSLSMTTHIGQENILDCVPSQDILLCFAMIHTHTHT